MLFILGVYLYLGVLHRKETASLLPVLKYVFEFILPKEIQLRNLTFTLIHKDVNRKDLLSKGKWKILLGSLSYVPVKTRIERFSIECRKTKTKVITTANQNKDKCHKEPIRTQSK